MRGPCQLLLDLVLFAVLGCAGCCIATFQTPDTLIPGEHGLTGGVSRVGFVSAESYDELDQWEATAMYRFGAGENLDYGARVYYTLDRQTDRETHLMALMADIKKCWGRSILFTFCGGASYVPPSWGDEVSWEGGSFYRDHKFGLHPAILFGSRHFWAGLKWPAYVVLEDQRAHFMPGIPSLSLGAAIGQRIKVIPEVNLLVPDSRLPFSFGLGLQYRWGPGADDQAGTLPGD